jgi:hypothetical protein
MTFSGGSQHLGDIGGRPNTGELAGQRPPFPPPDCQNQSAEITSSQETQGHRPAQPPSPHDSPVDRIEKLLETLGEGLAG